MPNSKQKGKRRELELAAKLRAYGFPDVRRSVQYCGTAGDADLVGIDGIHIECKGVEELDIKTAMQQAYRDSKCNEYPAVFHKQNRRPWMVTMIVPDIAEMYNFWSANVIKKHPPDHPLATMTLDDWVKMYKAVAE